MAEQLMIRGTLEGHSGWVTSLATSLEKYEIAECFWWNGMLTVSTAQTCSCQDLGTSP